MSKTGSPTDEFMTLLTDALRAGPGSPEWHHAVGELRKQGGNAADEYKLLYTARERLASGKEYRSIKPGVGFTRRLLEGIDRLPAGGKTRRPMPIATAIAVASLLVLIGIVAIVLYWTYGTPATPPKEDLSSMLFTQIIVDDHFDTALSTGKWRTIGTLPVIVGDGLKPGAAGTPDYSGGGIVTSSAVSTGGEPIAVDVSFDGVIGDVIPQVFVTDTPHFSPDRATSPHELVWTVQDGQAQIVLPDGHVAQSASHQVLNGKTEFSVHLLIGRDTARVETAGATLWAGPHGLGNDRGRYVGVRFLEKAGGKPATIRVRSIRIQKPAPN